MFHTLVLSGASTRLPALLGAYACAEERGHTGRLVTYVGASAGAVLGFLLSLGLRAAEAMAVVQRGVRAYRDRPDECVVEGLLTAFHTMGVDDGELVVGLLRDALEARLGAGARDATFLQLAKATGKHLVVCVSNLTDGRPEYWSVDTRPHLSVLTAVRASISLPFVFTPVVLDGRVYCDGGLFDNFPLRGLDRRAFGSTLGIRVEAAAAGAGDESQPQQQPPPQDLFAFAVLLLRSLAGRINALLAAAEQQEEGEERRAGGPSSSSLTCALPDACLRSAAREASTCGFDVRAMRFALCPEEAEALHEAGRAHMADVLRAHEDAVASRTNACS